MKLRIRMSEGTNTMAPDESVYPYEGQEFVVSPTDYARIMYGVGGFEDIGLKAQRNMTHGEWPMGHKMMVEGLKEMKVEANRKIKPKPNKLRKGLRP